MAEPILFQVGIEGADDILKVAEAIGQGLGTAFSKPNADIAQLNASIDSLSATITKLGAASTATTQQVQGMAAASAAFDALVASVDEFQAHLNASAEAAEKLAEHFEKLGQSSQQAGQQIHQMGEAGTAAAASFKLLQTSAGGVVELLTGGGLQAGISLVKELGEGVEKTAGHFGSIGEEIGKAVLHFSVFAAGIGALAVGAKELADHAKEDTLQIHALADALGTSEARILELKGSFGAAGVSMEQLAVSIRSVAVHMQDAWADIQRSVRDATLPINQDQLAIQAAVRGTEQAVIGAREAAMDTAQAQETASTAQADADRAAAEAQIAASEAVIHQKEAEFDAQNKLADAQRAYADAVTNASEAQLNLADAQKDFQYQGDDAWRSMADAIDKVADAERKAADEANAVQQAMLSVAEAATGVQSAYVSLYAAQLAYREAHGEGRITRQERAELRREQTEVGLQSAQERVQGAEFQYARTARDAVPEAQERQAKAERGVGAAKEAEDKAQQQYAESSQRAADKIEKAASALAAALERVAKAALEVRLAPQKAVDETAKAQLEVEGALANVRKTEFAATQATARAEDALETARLKEKAALDAITAAELAATAARNKAVDDLNNNINAVRQYIRTGRGPEGFDIRQTPPQQIARAFEVEAGGPGHMLDELKLLQKAFQDAIIPMSEFEGVMTAVGYARGILTTGTKEGATFRRKFDPRYRGTEAGAPLVEEPTGAQQARGEVVHERVAAAERLETAERKAASATSDLADDIGSKLMPAVSHVMEEIAKHPAEAAVGDIGALIGSFVAANAISALVEKLIAPAITKGFGSLIARWTGGAAGAAVGEAVGVGAGAAAGAGAAETVLPGIFKGGAFEAMATEAKAAEVGLAAVAKELGVAGAAAVTAEGAVGVFGVALGALLGPLTIVGGAIAFLIQQIPRMMQEEQTGPHSASVGAAIGALLHGGSLADAQAAATAGQGAKPPPPDRTTPYEKAPASQRLVGVDETPLPPALAPPAQRHPAAAVPTMTPAPDQKMDQVVQKLDEVASRIAEPKTDDVSQKIGALTDAIATSREHEAASGAEVGGDKMNVAADKLEEAAIKLEEAAGKIGGGGEFGAPEPGQRTQEGAKDAIDKIKESIDKLVGGKGLIEPPAGGTRERSSYDEAVRKLIESISQVNEAQKGLIEEQTKATAEGEQLAKKQEELTSANTEKVKQEAQDEAKLADAQANKLGQETSDGHEIALAQEELIHAQADQVQAQTNKITASDGHAAGGMVKGPGGIDKVPIMATAGEFVVNTASTSKNRGLLESINSGEPIHFQFGGIVPGEPPNLMGMIAAHGGMQPQPGFIQSALTSNIGMGPGGYMKAQMMQASKNPSYAVDLRTDHGTYAVLATEDQMGTMLQGSISAKIASTGTKPSWWS